MKTVLVAGTWSDSTPGDRKLVWWEPGSPFAAEAARNGVELLAPDDPFRWTTELEGIVGKNDAWQAAGNALARYCREKARGEMVNGIFHSHAGQVLAYAALSRRFHHVITVATPVRADMVDIYRRAARSISAWTHIYTGRGDRWQWLGALFDGYLGIRREMPAPARNVFGPCRNHISLLDPTLWTARGWWDLVKDTA